MSERLEPKSDVKEFLFKEYEHLATSLWESEKAGETRLNWFIGILGAFLAGIVTLGTGDHAMPYGKAFQVIVIAGQMGLMLYGTLTLRRIDNRNLRTDEAKRGLDAIRSLFKDERFDPEGLLKFHHPFGDSKRSIRTGGLRYTVILINWMLAIGISVFTLLFCTTPPIDRTYDILCVLIVSVVGMSYSWFFFLRFEDRPTHAGGIVFRKENGTIQYLIVRPSEKAEADKWVLPKGHIEPGERERETAIREVCEEGGVYAPIIAHVGNSTYEVGGNEVRASFYLMRAAAMLVQSEPRERAWLGLEEALSKLTHPRSRELLCKAEGLRKADPTG